jgi:RHS repeat-associated protein
MPVCEQEYEDGVLQQTRVNFLGARGIEAVVAIDHTRGNQVALRWLLYDGHGNLVRLMAPDYTLSAFQWRGVWGEVQGSLGTGRGYCANLGHPEDETGLVYMRARYYEPATGRFISEDSSRDGVNWYLYADGNPVNKVDVDGRRSSGDKIDWLIQLAKYYALGDYDSVALMVQLIAEYLLGVDPTTAEKIGDLVKDILNRLDLVTGKRAAKKAIEKTAGLWDQVIEHAKKIVDNPNSTAAKHWLNEIETWLKTIHRRVVE